MSESGGIETGRYSGIINGEPTPSGYDIYEGAHYQAPPRPHKLGHDILRRVVDANFKHEVSWQDIERRRDESIRTFTKLGVNEEALDKVASSEYTDWILWDGPSPPEVLSVEALINERSKPKAVVFKDSPATRMPSFMAEPAHQSGMDHLVGHLTHFHMGGDGQDEYLATRFQSLGIRQRIREGKYGQALYAPLMALGLVKHKDIRIGNHIVGAETIGRFPLDAFSDGDVPELALWSCSHTLVPMVYGDPNNLPEKRSRFIRALGGRVPNIQPYAASGSFYGMEELSEKLDELGFSPNDDTLYDTYPYDAKSHSLLVIEKSGEPSEEDIQRLVSLESFIQDWEYNLDESPPPLVPATLSKTLISAKVMHI